MKTLHRAVLAYMGARCRVSSQHKLPGREELHETVTLGLLFSRKDIDDAIDFLLKEKKLVQYGPYLSDHVIDVL